MDITGIGSAIQGITSLVSKWIPDKTQEQQNEFVMELTALNGQLNALQGQIEVDKTEAANPNLFVAGWRPFIGWVCGAACAWNWIGISIAKTICAVAHYTIVLEPASLTEMLPILLGMLGLGAYRTVEKLQGINSGH
jgi:hypothetical protein